MKPLEQAFRDERAAVLATITRRLGGDLALAEDAVQDAFVAAAVAWDRRGVRTVRAPGSPRPRGARRSTGSGTTAWPPPVLPISRMSP